MTTMPAEEEEEEKEEEGEETFTRRTALKMNAARGDGDELGRSGSPSTGSTT